MEIYKLIVESYRGEVLSEGIYIKKSRAIEDAKKWIADKEHISEEAIIPCDGKDFIFFFSDKKYDSYKDIYIEIEKTCD